ncbi:MAG: precorrin-6y C5,15-methyltransferase (decarboxylating) subunit CbiE [Desulfobulbaceae bacterium]|nr:precorrin-6y C5,15-methyltransferase (decarboxylating) subunit CbiE [Desulfobulbaceae bacterium]
MSGRLYVVGVGVQGLTVSQKQILADCALIVSSERHMSLVEGIAVDKIAITPLSDALGRIKQTLPSASVGVLASGDPLFYGIGRRILAAFEPEQVAVLPALSSMQEACARFKTPWDDVSFVSLHGREYFHLPGLLLTPKTFILTDRRNSPDRIATQLLDYLNLIGDENLKQDCLVRVGENIGADNERFVSGSLAEIAAQRFDDLNVMLLTCPGLNKKNTGCFGLCEEKIFHSRGLITKDEVRAVTLHKLQLPLSGIMWDIGAGSGSVSVEAARMNPGLTVYAVERKDEAMANIKENIRRFRCYNVIPVAGLAPVALQKLPAPDRVFIGGSGGHLSPIISYAAGQLPAGGRLVVNGVLAKTIDEAPLLMQAQGLSVSMSTIQCERKNLAREGTGTSLNPITVIVGKK